MVRIPRVDGAIRARDVRAVMVRVMSKKPRPYYLRTYSGPGDIVGAILFVFAVTALVFWLAP